MGITRSTDYDKPAVSLDDTALVEAMVTICESVEAPMAIAGCRQRCGISA